MFLGELSAEDDGLPFGFDFGGLFALLEIQTAAAVDTQNLHITFSAGAERTRFPFIVLLRRIYFAFPRNVEILHESHL